MHLRLRHLRLWSLLIAAGCSGESGDTDTQSEEPPEPSSDWCERIAAGPPGDGAFLLELSAAHERIRHFGFAADYATADAALAAALADPDGLGAFDADAYVAGLSDACALDADATALPAVDITSFHGFAWIRPGTGAVTLPEGTRAVVIDLRDLPAADGLAEALAAAVAPALAWPVQRPHRTVREFFGFPDQFFTPNNAYTTQIVTRYQDSLAPAGDAELPIVVVTGAVMAPEAAAFAATLRLERRASLVGEDVLAAVSEAHQASVGSRSIAFRSGVNGRNLAPWPDVIPADVRTLEPEEVIGAPWDWPLHPEQPATATAARSTLTAYAPFGAAPSATTGLGEARAALVVEHGILRQFFPYFDIVGDDIDDRLQELVPAITAEDAADRTLMLHRVGQLLAGVHDSHGFTYDTTRQPAGCLAVTLDVIDGLPVVARSADAALVPGDTILEMDGVPVADLYAAASPGFSAGNDSHLAFVTWGALRQLDGPVTLRLRDPDAVERTVVVDPQDCATMNALGVAPSVRESGWLDDLGAPDVYYLNLDGVVTPDLATGVAAITEATDAAGMVVDLRGYPPLGFDCLQLVRHLAPSGFADWQWLWAFTEGDDAVISWDTQVVYTPQTPVYAGPVVLLVDPTTLSAAEWTSELIRDAKDPVVIGRQSAGANGNITAGYVPGSFVFSFTGAEGRRPDRTDFFGVGILPDVTVVPQPADYRDGYDRALAQAIATLGG